MLGLFSISGLQLCSECPKKLWSHSECCTAPRQVHPDLSLFSGHCAWFLKHQADFYIFTEQRRSNHCIILASVYLTHPVICFQTFPHPRSCHFLVWVIFTMTVSDVIFPPDIFGCSWLQQGERTTQVCLLQLTWVASLESIKTFRQLD